MAYGYLSDDDENDLTNLPDLDSESVSGPMARPGMADQFAQYQALKAQQEAQNEQDIQTEVEDLSAQFPEGPAEPEVEQPPTIQPRPIQTAKLDEFQQLLAERQARLRDLNMLKAAQNIGQAFVGGHTGNFKVDHSLLDDLSKQANIPVEDYSLKQKIQKARTGLVDDEELRNPKSKISAFFRLMAKQRGLEVTEDMSAWDIQNMGKVMGKPNQGIMKDQQTQYLNTETGNPLIFQMGPDGRGQYVDSITLQKPNGIVRSILTADAMGTKYYTPGPGKAPIKAIGSEYAQTKAEVLDKDYERLTQGGQEFAPNKDQREALTEEKKRLDKVLAVSKEQLNSANSVLGVLEGDKKLAVSVVKARMPRVMGEVGNLNQTEQDMWTGSQALLDRVWQWLNGITVSELTEDNKKELRKILIPFSKSAKAASDYMINTSAS